MLSHALIKINYTWEPQGKYWVRNNPNKTQLPGVITSSDPDWFEPLVHRQPSCEERLASVEQELKDLQQKYQDDMNDLAKTAMGGTDPD